MIGPDDLRHGHSLQPKHEGPQIEPLKPIQKLLLDLGTDCSEFQFKLFKTVWKRFLFKKFFIWLNLWGLVGAQSMAFSLNSNILTEGIILN